MSPQVGIQMCVSVGTEVMRFETQISPPRASYRLLVFAQDFLLPDSSMPLILSRGFRLLLSGALRSCGEVSRLPIM
jgi:hypothetical protein